MTERQQRIANALEMAAQLLHNVCTDLVDEVGVCVDIEDAAKVRLTSHVLRSLSTRIWNVLITDARDHAKREAAQVAGRTSRHDGGTLVGPDILRTGICGDLRGVADGVGEPVCGL